MHKYFAAVHCWWEIKLSAKQKVKHVARTLHSVEELQQTCSTETGWDYESSCQEEVVRENRKILPAPEKGVTWDPC